MADMFCLKKGFDFRVTFIKPVFISSSREPNYFCSCFLESGFQMVPQFFRIVSAWVLRYIKFPFELSLEFLLE